MATACCTSGWRGQKINVYCISVVQEKLLPPDKEEDGRTPRPPFLFFSFIFSPFHLFTTNVTRALPVGTIKDEEGATSRGIEASNERRNEHTHTSPRQPHTSPLKRDL
jgi:hypothetical protein